MGILKRGEKEKDKKENYIRNIAIRATFSSLSSDEHSLG